MSVPVLGQCIIHSSLWAGTLSPVADWFGPMRSVRLAYKVMNPRTEDVGAEVVRRMPNSEFGGASDRRNPLGGDRRRASPDGAKRQIVFRTCEVSTVSVAPVAFDRRNCAFSLP